MKQYVIIGDSAAAVGCIEGIRSVDKDSKITVVSEENHPVYCRPLISYYLENKTDSERMNYRGAGLIGLKCAEGLHERVKSITVCDLADRVLSSILDTDCAAIVQRHLEANGIQFLLGDTAVRFEKNLAQMKNC